MPEDGRRTPYVYAFSKTIARTWGVLRPSFAASRASAAQDDRCVYAALKMNTRPALGLMALLLLAAVLAAVVIAALLLVGVEPHLVFLPGFFVRSRLDAMGLHVPNRVGVLVTAAVWWVIIVAIWLGLRRLVRRGA